MLVDLWQAVLGLDQVGVADNFFAIGGDSIKERDPDQSTAGLLGEYVYVVAIFDAPTVLPWPTTCASITPCGQPPS